MVRAGVTGDWREEPPQPPLGKGGAETRRGDDSVALAEPRHTIQLPPFPKGGLGGSSRPHPRALAWLLLALTSVLPGCRPASAPVDTNATQGSPAATDAATDATATAAKPTDEITLPEGTPEELFQFLQELETRTMGMVQDAAATDPEARAAAIRRLMSARVRACDKILATEIPPETRASAVQMKLDALRTLVALEPAQWKEPFTDYSQQLLDGTDPLLGRLAQTQSLSCPGERGTLVR